MVVPIGRCHPVVRIGRKGTIKGAHGHETCAPFDDVWLTLVLLYGSIVRRNGTHRTAIRSFEASGENKTSRIIFDEYRFGQSALMRRAGEVRSVSELQRVRRWAASGRHTRRAIMLALCVLPPRTFFVDAFDNVRQMSQFYWLYMGTKPEDEPCYGSR